MRNEFSDLKNNIPKEMLKKSVQVQCGLMLFCALICSLPAFFNLPQEDMNINLFRINISLFLAITAVIKSLTV